MFLQKQINGRKNLLETFLSQIAPFCKKLPAYIRIHDASNYKYTLSCDYSSSQQREFALDQIAYLSKNVGATHITGLYIEPLSQISPSEDLLVLFDLNSQGVVGVDTYRLKKNSRGKIKQCVPTDASIKELRFRDILSRAVKSTPEIRQAIAPILAQCMAVHTRH